MTSGIRQNRPKDELPAQISRIGWPASVNLPKYVLVTPARNEARFIELTLRSVIAQTVKPMKWVIASDGSTDGTDEIVQKYAADHRWIELVRRPEHSERNFAGKVHAFNAGRARVEGLEYEVIGSLDADISFDEQYFAFLLGKMVENPRLGVVGTPFKDVSQPMYDYRFVNIEHVSGACQLFRRECFEEIGGYVPVQGGSIDHIAVVTARLKGWQTRTFPEKVCLHHREIGTAQQGTLAAKYTYGRKDYAMGNHPLWEVFRAVYQLTKPPVVLGGLALLGGYLTAALSRRKRPVSAEVVEFLQREQLSRLRRFLRGRRNSGTAALEKAS